MDGPVAGPELTAILAARGLPGPGTTAEVSDWLCLGGGGTGGGVRPPIHSFIVFPKLVLPAPSSRPPESGWIMFNHSYNYIINFSKFGTASLVKVQSFSSINKKGKFIWRKRHVLSR